MICQPTVTKKLAITQFEEYFYVIDCGQMNVCGAYNIVTFPRSSDLNVTLACPFKVTVFL